MFVASALGIIPTAALMGRATEELASRSGAPDRRPSRTSPSATRPELIIALFALGQGLHELVKATLIGSIIGNILLVLGASMLVGGLGRTAPDLQPTVRERPEHDAAGWPPSRSPCPRCSSWRVATGCPTVGPERIEFGSTVELLSGSDRRPLLIVIYV